MRRLFFSFLIVLFLAAPSFAAQYLFVSDFETGGIQSPSSNPDGWSQLKCLDYNAQVVSDIVRAGNYALHLRLYQQEDNFCFGGVRVQLDKLYPNPETRFQLCQGHWIGYSLYIPEDWPDTDDKGECGIMDVNWYSLIHSLSGPQGSSSGNETIVSVWDDEAGTGGSCAPWDGEITLYNKPIVKGEWVDWVFYFYPSIHSASYNSCGGKTGVIKAWRNGVQVINYTPDYPGGTFVRCWWGGYLSVRIYKADWDTDPTDYNYLHLYFDEVRILYDAEDNATNYNIVDPAQGSGSSLPTVTSQATTSITNTTAIGHGTITSTGGVNATKRGICWNTTGSPTVASDKVEEAGNFSTGAFSGNMTGLTPDLRVFAKPYAYNTAGYGYGSEVLFDPVASGTYIIDNEDNATGETQSTGNWYSSGGASPYGIGSIYSHEVNATFSFEETLDGNHTVSLWWTELASRSAAVTVKIYDSGDNLLDTKSVNQTTLGGQWNSQGTYDFNATAKVVVYSTGGGGPVSTCADAVKFDYVEGSGGEDVNESSCLHGIHLQGCVLN